MVKCLTCQEEMERKDFSGVEIDMCPSCRSVWLDGGELEEIIGLDPADGKIFSCEECGYSMNKKLILGIEIDYCPSCGAVWLDPGELEKLSRKPVIKGNKALFNFVRMELGPKYERLSSR